MKPTTIVLVSVLVVIGIAMYFGHHMAVERAFERGRNTALSAHVIDSLKAVGAANVKMIEEDNEEIAEGAARTEAIKSTPTLEKTDALRITSDLAVDSLASILGAEPGLGAAQR